MKKFVMKVTKVKVGGQIIKVQDILLLSTIFLF